VCIIKLVHRGGLYDKAYVQTRIDRSNEVEESGGKLSAKLNSSGQDDMSILAMQRLNDQYVVLLIRPVDSKAKSSLC
jgi:polyamine oxidase